MVFKLFHYNQLKAILHPNINGFLDSIFWFFQMTLPYFPDFVNLKMMIFASHTKFARSEPRR